jgi:hypothetical protein
VVSAALDRAIRRALAVQRVLQRKPNAAATFRAMDAAIADIQAAAVADPSSPLPEPLVEGLMYMLLSGTARPAAFAATALRWTLPRPSSSGNGSRLLQARGANQLAQSISSVVRVAAIGSHGRG